MAVYEQLQLPYPQSHVWDFSTEQQEKAVLWAMPWEDQVCKTETSLVTLSWTAGAAWAFQANATSPGNAV